MAFRFRHCRSTGDSIFAPGFDSAGVYLTYPNTLVGRGLVSHGNVNST